MTVLRHPYMPSFEGAYPDLTGLEVLVKWTDGKEKIVTETSEFTVYPPVAFVKEAGTHVTTFSKKGEYAIQYIGDGLYDLNVYRVNVYIPAVIALADPANDSVEGKLEEVYEDVGITTAGVTYKAAYTAFEFGEDNDYADYVDTLEGEDLEDALAEEAEAWEIPADSYYTYLSDLYLNSKGENRWPDFTTADKANVKENSISANPEAWQVNARGETYTATYFATLGAPSDGYGEDKSVDIKNFYKVDRFEYVSGIDKVDPIAADDKDLSGSSEAVQEAWWKYLLKADSLKFKVIYYLAKDSTAKKSRDVTMADYVRALYTVDNDNKPRAALPVLSGGEDATTPSVVESVVEGYDLSLRLFYYAPLIEGTIGKGIMPESGEYSNANAAIVPISSLIGVYKGLKVERKDGTDHTGEPEIYNYWDETDSINSLYNELQSYWTVYFEYENPRDASKSILVEADWPETAAEGLTDFDFDVADARELRECTVTFIGPDSVENEEAEWAFNYYMLP